MKDRLLEEDLDRQVTFDNTTSRERRVLFAALRTQRNSINIRLKNVTLSTNRATIDNLNQDLQTTNELIATLQPLVELAPKK